MDYEWFDFNARSELIHAPPLPTPTHDTRQGQRVAAKVMTTRRVDVGCIREYVRAVGCHHVHTHESSVD